MHDIPNTFAAFTPKAQLYLVKLCPTATCMHGLHRVLPTVIVENDIKAILAAGGCIFQHTQLMPQRESSLVQGYTACCRI